MASYAFCLLAATLPLALPAVEGYTADCRRVEAVRVARAPVVDGRLDDEAWKLAPDAGPLIQVVPVEGAEPSERTEFRFVYDDHALYVGVWCFDREPRAILAREMARDGPIYDDDYVAISLDTFHDRRNGYLFTVNPNGAQLDFLISNNTEADSNWDGIWRVAARIDGEGWKAEVEFPFRSLGFDPSGETWGLNLLRYIARRSERCHWSGARQNLWTFNFAEAGELTGLRGLEPGLDLELVPYALSRYRDSRVEGDEDLTFDAGGEINYRITPRLTARMSYNMDFAETEVDARQINLTRFPLFFPEKRDFFLEDGGIFRFGGLGQELIPFFSRRIGLAEGGKVVPIDVASKLTGRIDSYNFGLIDALVGNHDGLGMKNVLVARASKNILEQSSAGVLLTQGDPNTEDESFLAGADFGYRTSKLFGDNVLEANAFVLGSVTEGASNGDSLAFGGKVDLPNDLYWAKVQVYQIGKDFNPALGFVPRKDVRAYTSAFHYGPRPESVQWLRQVVILYSNEHFTDLDDRLETAHHGLYPFYAYLESGEEAYFSFNYQLDAPREDFEISEGVVIPPGDYWWLSYKTGFLTARKRPLALDFDYVFGGFYEGEQERFSLGSLVRPSKYVSFHLGYSLGQIRLPEGDFETRLASVSLKLSLSPHLSWFHLIQYDNVTDTLGYNGRVHWELRPGADVYLVLNQNIDRREGRLRWVESELTVKVGVSFRF